MPEFTARGGFPHGTSLPSTEWAQVHGHNLVDAAVAASSLALIPVPDGVRDSLPTQVLSGVDEYQRRYGETIREDREARIAPILGAKTALPILRSAAEGKTITSDDLEGHREAIRDTYPLITDGAAIMGRRLDLGTRVAIHADNILSSLGIDGVFDRIIAPKMAAKLNTHRGQIRSYYARAEEATRPIRDKLITLGEQFKNPQTAIALEARKLVDEILQQADDMHSENPGERYARSTGKAIAKVVQSLRENPDWEQTYPALAELGLGKLLDLFKDTVTVDDKFGTRLALRRSQTPHTFKVASDQHGTKSVIEIPTEEIFGVIAPEIMYTLETLAVTQRSAKNIQSRLAELGHSSHKLRLWASLSSTTRRGIHHLQEAPRFANAIRELIPTSSAQAASMAAYITGVVTLDRPSTDVIEVS